MLRNIWNLPNTTHRYLLEKVSNSNHIKLCLFKRYLTFVHSLKNSHKRSLASLANLVCSDKHSITCQNLDYISSECNVDAHCVNPYVVLQTEYIEVPQEEIWHIDTIKELIKLRDGELILENDQFSREDICDMINIVATS